MSHRALLRRPGFLRLWVAGGLSSALLWLEVLAAALFTLDATGSALDVALVSAARSLPLLGFGAVVGVLADRYDRRLIVLGGLLLTATSSAGVAALASAGVLRPWELALAALASGCAYATEMPARRRMVAEAAPPSLLGRAIAIDSLTNFATRCAGPLIGGVAYGGIGTAGTFATSATASLIGAALVAGLPRSRTAAPTEHPAIWTQLREGVRFAAGRPALRTMLGVTMAMNLFGYAYTTLVSPMGREVFGLTDAQIGVLAAAEPGGALVAGLVFAQWAPDRRPLAWLSGGVLALMAGLVLAGLLPNEGAVLGVLFVAGFGSASFTNHQSTIALRATPEALRSRVLGLITACIGLWPVGILVAGALTGVLSAAHAMTSLGVAGLLALVAAVALGRDRRAR